MEQKAPEAQVGAPGKVVAIALVALLAVCFVGSCSVAGVSLVSAVADGTSKPQRVSDPDWKKPKVKSPLATPKAPKDDDDSAPKDPLAALDDDKLPPAVDDPGTPEPETRPFVARDVARAQFAIFHPTKAKTDGWKAVQKLAKAAKLNAYLDEEPDEEVAGAYVVFHAFTADDYAPLGGETLDFAHGLSDKEKDALVDSQNASVLDVVIPLEKAAKLQDVEKLMADLQKSTGGVLWDEDTQEYFSPAEWKKRRLDGWDKGTPDAMWHFSVFMTAKDGMTDLETGGMGRFGLPDLRLTKVPNSGKNAATNMINSLAQLMVEGKVEGAPGPVTLRLSDIKHKTRKEAARKLLLEGAQGQTEVTLVSSGDFRHPLLDLTFPGSGSAGARLDQALTALFGSSDRVDQIEHDAELKALSAKQMKIFSTTIKKRFEKGLKTGESLMVKAPFPADSGGNEWMWVEVTKIKPDGTILGTLANDPDDVADLMSGDEVVVVEAELFDWMFKEKNGTELGNETGKLMLKRLGR